WSEQARHIYQEQGGELSVVDLVLANESGLFDFLMHADVIGRKVELRRGDPGDAWADMEFVLIARVASRRFEGYSIILDLENWLSILASPFYTETFPADTPNPQLVGKSIPLVLGEVTQAPVYEINPRELEFFTATNVSRIGEVQEGGNPTERWAFDDEVTFRLFGNPTLPVTANFAGKDVGFQSLFSSDFGSFSGGLPDDW